METEEEEEVVLDISCVRKKKSKCFGISQLFFSGTILIVLDVKELAFRLPAVAYWT